MDTSDLATCWVRGSTATHRTMLRSTDTTTHVQAALAIPPVTRSATEMTRLLKQLRKQRRNDMRDYRHGKESYYKPADRTGKRVYVGDEADQSPDEVILAAGNSKGNDRRSGIKGNYSQTAFDPSCEAEGEYNNHTNCYCVHSMRHSFVHLLPKNTLAMTQGDVKTAIRLTPPMHDAYCTRHESVICGIGPREHYWRLYSR